MGTLSHSNFLRDYETANSGLKLNPSDLTLQHKAVLALARMGSLDLACQEYQKYELDKIRHHEDIMSLGGRLHKDLYLKTVGKNASEHARNAAVKYDAAFRDTQGFYSGVNAATMALIADMPWEVIQSRIDQILNLLPQTQSHDPAQHYFIEATRAECLLLQGKKKLAQRAFRNAVNFDPLNYTSHGSTLKQFKMILDKQQQNHDWLSEFLPPRPVHYAGHIWSSFQTGSIMTDLSHLIQEHDIGFGYGALAAGADIVIAEALLEEGTELNVTLPSTIDKFLDTSVKPYGKGWMSRCLACLDEAQTITTLPDNNPQNIDRIRLLAAQMAMGQTIMRSQQLNNSPLQLLLKHPERRESMVAKHEQDWALTGYDILHMDVSHIVESFPAQPRDFTTIDLRLATSESGTVRVFNDLSEAVGAVLMKENKTSSIHFDLMKAQQDVTLLLAENKTNSIFVTEAVAYFATLKHGSDYNIKFAGLIDKNGTSLRVFTLDVLS